MPIYPNDPRPQPSCPLHCPFQLLNELSPAVSCISHIRLVQPHLHGCCCCSSPPPPIFDFPSTRRPECAGGLERRNFEREAIHTERQHDGGGDTPARYVKFDVPAISEEAHLRRYIDHFDGAARQERYKSGRSRAPIQTLPRPRNLSLEVSRRDTPPSQPTIYIITYSLELTPNSKALTELLRTHLPHRNPPIPHLYTIDASKMQPPPNHLCALYSGLSPVIQAHVLRDPRARWAIQEGVKDLVDFGKSEWAKGFEGRRFGERGTARMEVAISVCCLAGTHRSVAIADLIAQGAKREVGRLGTEGGVRVIVRHVHRIKGRGDPF